MNPEYLTHGLIVGVAPEMNPEYLTHGSVVGVAPEMNPEYLTHGSAAVAVAQWMNHECRIHGT